MIGQKNILKWVDNNIDNFPHFIVLVGASGSGKKTLCKTIAHKLSMVYSQCEIRAEAVREVINTSYQSHTKVMYCFADADNMKAAAKNAMLKVTEEPPKDAYFCLTVTDSSSLLDTIKSRAYVMNMEEYSGDDIFKYYWDYTLVKQIDNPDDAELARLLCSTPGEVQKLVEMQPQEFKQFVELVMDNIADVEPANAFKSSNKIALKTDEGYDLALFWKCFTQLCLDRMDAKNADNIIHYSDGIIVTSKYLNQVSRLGVNKQQLYDNWVFDIREKWYEENE